MDDTCCFACVYNECALYANLHKLCKFAQIMPERYMNCANCLKYCVQGCL